MAEDTRHRIISGAYRALVHHGYAATSVKHIATEAGVAPGLIHYYFASKEELLIAVIRHGCQQVRPASSAGAAHQLRAALEAKKRSLSLHQDFNRLFFGMLGVGLHDPRIAQAIGDFIHEQRADVERLLRAAIAERGGRESAAPALAATVWGAAIGIALQDLLDPNFAAEVAIDALATLVLGSEDRETTCRSENRRRPTQTEDISYHDSA